MEKEKSAAVGDFSTPKKGLVDKPPEEVALPAATLPSQSSSGSSSRVHEGVRSLLEEYPAELRDLVGTPRNWEDAQKGSPRPQWGRAGSPLGASPRSNVDGAPPAPSMSQQELLDALLKAEDTLASDHRTKLADEASSHRAAARLHEERLARLETLLASAVESSAAQLTHIAALEARRDEWALQAWHAGVFAAGVSVAALAVVAVALWRRT